MTDAAARLFETLDNLQGPIGRLQRSLANGAGSFPLAEPVMNDAVIDEVDQFLQRFQQVADIVLRKLFPRLAIVATGGQAPQFFRDLLDTLERAEIIDDASWWVALNDRRNRLVHEYAMQPDVRIAELNGAWAAASIIVDEIARIRILAEKL